MAADVETMEITVIAPGGIRAALQKIIPAFEKATGSKVVATFASGGATKARVAAGDLFDVPVMQPPLEQVIASGELVAASATPLASVSVAVAVRAEASKPDISDMAAVKRLLLAAESIACPSAARGAACGVSFEETLTRLGIKDTVARKVRAAPSGWGAIAMLARGEVDLGITFMSEIDPDDRVELLGPLPSGVSTPTGFVAFVHRRSACPEAAAALIRFLRSAEAARVFTECGMTPAR